MDARGLTDIKSPLLNAVMMLKNSGSQGGAKGAGPNPLPTMFLITDGCVENEREICEEMGRLAAMEAYQLQQQQQQQQQEPTGWVQPKGLPEQQGPAGWIQPMGLPEVALGAQPQPPIPPTGPAPRLSTFAIGPYANHFFLKQLATYGRGAFDVAFRPHAIQSQMQKMLLAAQVGGTEGK